MTKVEAVPGEEPGELDAGAITVTPAPDGATGTPEGKTIGVACTGIVEAAAGPDEAGEDAEPGEDIEPAEGLEAAKDAEPAEGMEPAEDMEPEEPEADGDTSGPTPELTVATGRFWPEADISEATEAWDI